VSWLNFGIELDVIAPTMPEITRIAQEILDLIGVAIHRSELIDWNIDK
jgi:hypothetical protein